MTILPYFKLLRVHQWAKNLLLLFPPFFAGKIFDPAVLGVTFPSLVAFSFAASCGYIVNDIRDSAADKQHATKKNRMIASGKVLVPYAIAIAAALYIFAILFSSAVSRVFEWYVMLYLFISLAYTFFLKDIFLVDIFAIASGFLLRVVAGGEAFEIPVTNWLFLTVFMVSLLLAAGKRLAEIITLGDDASRHRRSLLSYSSSFLEGILWFSASAALVTYALYTLEHASGLFYTVPLAAFGLLRYIYIVKEGNGDPTEVLLKDGQIMGVGILWVAMIGFVIYR